MLDSSELIKEYTIEILKLVYSKVLNFNDSLP